MRITLFESRSPGIWLVSILSVLVLSACETIDLESDGINSAQEVKGKIVLPTGSNLDVSTFTVVSNIDDSPVNGTSYGLSKGGKFTGLYVSNANDEVVMMGIQYPGNPTNEINSTTTALGLILMAPIFFDLTEEGMLKLIDSILKDSNFPSLKSEIEKNLGQGRSLFDVDNAPLIATLNPILRSAGLRVAQNEKELPVNVFKAGKNFTFNNSGKSFSTVIGLSKGSDRVKKITVEGVQIVASSITELLTGKGGTFEASVDQSFTIPSDGDYTFKFRTGKPGSGDGSLEHDEAFYENLGKFSVYILSGLLPESKDTKLGCLSSVKMNAINSISTLTSLNVNASLSSILLTVAELTVNNVGSLLKDCTTAKPKKKFLDFFLKQLKLFSIISGGMNTGAFGAQWLSSDAVVDVCYTAKGNEVTQKNESCGDFADPRDGNVYKIVKIGNQTWFAENLKYLGNIPNVVSDQAWAAVPPGQPALSYNYSLINGAFYGILYNWYAVNTGKLCPQGWHIPTDAELTTLTNYLGGDAVAGGKMKSIIGWSAPNTGATNDTGFTGLPGGFRDKLGSSSSTSIGHLTWGYWWTSSPADANKVRGWALSWSGGKVYRLNDTFQQYGFSCRCLMD